MLGQLIVLLCSIIQISCFFRKSSLEMYGTLGIACCIKGGIVFANMQDYNTFMQFACVPEHILGLILVLLVGRLEELHVLHTLHARAHDL